MKLDMKTVWGGTSIIFRDASNSSQAPEEIYNRVVFDNPKSAAFLASLSRSNYRFTMVGRSDSFLMLDFIGFDDAISNHDEYLEILLSELGLPESAVPTGKRGKSVPRSATSRSQA